MQNVQYELDETQTCGYLGNPLYNFIVLPLHLKVTRIKWHQAKQSQLHQMGKKEMVSEWAISSKTVSWLLNMYLLNTV